MLERRCVQLRSSPRPFDQSLGGSIQEDQLGVKLFFQFQLACLPHLKEQDGQNQPGGGAEEGGACLLLLHQEDVRAQFEDPVDAGELLKHDGVADPAEELPHELPDHQHHRGVQSHNTAATETGAGTEKQNW